VELGEAFLRFVAARSEVPVEYVLSRESSETVVVGALNVETERKRREDQQQDEGFKSR
jgi:hypothetical protein